MNIDEQAPGLSTLNRAAFATSTDPRFLWPGKTYRDALATLRDGTLENAGLLLLTGDPGTGKTLVTNALLDRLGGKVRAAKLTYPTLSPADFYEFLGTAFAIEADSGTRASFLPAFASFADEAAARDERVLLVIDDAQSLTPELFEELLHFLEPAPAGKPRANILLVGPNDLPALLKRDHASLAERMRIRCGLSPLSESETAEYIRHHLVLAGSDADRFTPTAIHAVFCASGGTPGLITVLCDLALRSAHAQGAGSIGEEVVSECAKTLGLLSSELDRPPPAALPTPAQYTQEDREALLAALKGTTGRQDDRPRWRTIALQAAAAVLLIVLGGLLGVYLASSGRQGTAPLDTRGPEGRATSGEAALPTSPVEKPPAALTPSSGESPEKVLQRTRPAPAALPAARTPPRAAVIEPGPGRSAARPEARPKPARPDEEAGLRSPDPTAGAAQAERAREDPESPDPGAVIDWILSKQPPPNR